MTSSSSSPDGPRGLSILGSTGSIGTQTLEVVRLFPEQFDVRALTCGTNVELLAEQVQPFAVELDAGLGEHACEQVHLPQFFGRHVRTHDVVEGVANLGIVAAILAVALELLGREVFPAHTVHALDFRTLLLFEQVALGEVGQRYGTATMQGPADAERALPEGGAEPEYFGED